MGHIRIHFLLCITFLLVIFTCSEAETISSTESQKNQNLRAFAKLYGYVKYFHPSDEASAIDWDKFAIYGAKQVKDAKNTEELKTALEGLFLPIAPTIQIYTSDQEPEDPMKHVPDDTTGLKIVAWQHEGVWLNTPSCYRSARLNRKHRFLLARFGTATQSINATDYRGKETRLRAFVKTNVSGSGNQGQLFLKIDRESRERGFFDDMNDRPIRSKEWKAYEIIGNVADDATRISFGCHLKAMGQLWVDEFQLSVKDEGNEWQAVNVKNPGFEEGQANGEPEGWSDDSSFGHSIKIDTEDPYKGDKCLLIQDRSTILSGKLFEEHPKIGEVVNKPLGSDLFCQIPLALCSDKNGTLGKNEKYPLPKLLEKMGASAAGTPTANDEDVRLADVVIAWNVFQHFYPYFDVVGADWDLELTSTLRKAMRDKNERDFHHTLIRLVAKLGDKHGWAEHARIESQWSRLPFYVDSIEDQVVVIASKEPTKVKIGDIIVSIGGTGAEQALLDGEAYIWASPQSRRLIAVKGFSYCGDKGTTANLLIRRGDQTFELEMERTFEGRISDPNKRPKIDKIQDDIFYVDLRRAKMTDIKERINDLANAKGVIFDLRGYPASDISELICHLLQEKDTSGAWMRIPKIIYPDYENVVGYFNYGWGLKPKEPQIKGKVVFLTDATAISAAESYLSFVEHYKLGEILGQPTAGTNGNVNWFSLPGGYRVAWTGMKVVKHDGSQHHLIGILPTVPVRRTIQGVIEGRDEFFEKALEIINKH